MPNENGTARLDRIERALELLIADHEQFRVDYRQLLTAQILTNDQVQKTHEEVQKLTIAVADLTRSQNRTDQRLNEVAENLNALIKIVDGIIRNRPPLS